MKKLIGIIGAGIVAQLSGHAVWVLALINLAWMLFKDAQLFSWWWVTGSAVVFLVSIVVVLVSVVHLKD